MGNENDKCSDFHICNLTEIRIELVFSIITITNFFYMEANVH